MLISDLPHKVPGDEDLLLLARENAVYATKVKNAKALNSSFLPMGGGVLAPHSPTQPVASTPYYLPVGGSCYWFVYPERCANVNVVIPAGSLLVVRAYPMEASLNAMYEYMPNPVNFMYATDPNRSSQSTHQRFAHWSMWPPYETSSYDYGASGPSIVFGMKLGTDTYHLGLYGESVVYFAGRQDVDFSIGLSIYNLDQTPYLQASVRYSYLTGSYTQVSISSACARTSVLPPGEVVVFQMERLL